jgi:7-keto-8-aminopelargonate synthetase-like enzyme
VLDEYADPSFFDGAHATTLNVSKFTHLDEVSLEEKLKDIRGKDKENSILVAVEGLYSVDSTSHNISNLQKLTAKYNAYLLVNLGHDIGVFGKKGRGIW